jgi:hypothetical protein
LPAQFPDTVSAVTLLRFFLLSAGAKDNKKRAKKTRRLSEASSLSISSPEDGSEDGDDDDEGISIKRLVTETKQEAAAATERAKARDIIAQATATALTNLAKGQADTATVLGSIQTSLQTQQQSQADTTIVLGSIQTSLQTQQQALLMMMQKMSEQGQGQPK